MLKKPFRISDRIRSFKHAFEGLIELFGKEHNSWIHSLAALAIIITGFIVHLSTTEWILIVFAIGFVFITELINSSIERLIDILSPEIHPLAKQAKDLAAAAVLIAAITAVIIGILILGPKVFP